MRAAEQRFRTIPYASSFDGPVWFGFVASQGTGSTASAAAEARSNHAFPVYAHNVAVIARSGATKQSRPGGMQLGRDCFALLAMTATGVIAVA
jgi:hypothetical protein